MEEGSSSLRRSTLQSVLNMSTLTRSFQELVGGMNSLPGRINPNRRRSSLPAPALTLDPALKRTRSHKNFPHLSQLDVTQSTPKCFSPKCLHEEKQMHCCHSHCTLPHLPGSNQNKRRKSLPVDFSKPHIIDAVKNRRKSFPLNEQEHRERELHRCKALHKANITIDDIAKEFINLKSQNETNDLKKVKSEPLLPIYKALNGVSLVSLGRNSSKSFHGTRSSVVKVHHFDSKYGMHDSKYSMVDSKHGIHDSKHGIPVGIYNDSFQQMSSLNVIEENEAN